MKYIPELGVFKSRHNGPGLGYFYSESPTPETTLEEFDRIRVMVENVDAVRVDEYLSNSNVRITVRTVDGTSRSLFTTATAVGVMWGEVNPFTETHRPYTGITKYPMPDLSDLRGLLERWKIKY